MCQIVQRVWVGQQTDKKTEYLVLRNRQCTCMRPADRLECSKATHFPGPSQLIQPVSPFPLCEHAIDSVC